jgi:enoyl-CoA hydratase
MNESDYKMTLVEKKDYIGFLTLNNPEKRNALSPELLMDVYQNLEAFSKNDDVRCLVIKGSGNKVFSSSYDISALPVSTLSGTKPKTPNVLLILPLPC